MPRPLSGLTTSFIQAQPEADPQQVHGGTVDPSHTGGGKQPEPYPWQIPQWGSEIMGPYGTDSSLVGETAPENASLPAGHGIGDSLELDQTPYRTHAAPFPKNAAGDGSTSPDNVARQLIQSAAIHAVKTNASGRSTYVQGLDPLQDDWVAYESVTPGTSLQPQGVPQSVGTTVAGFGSRDRVNSRAPQNQHGFDSAHLHRRVARGSIPGNYLWMKPGSRPMVRTLPGAMRLPIGRNSPFAGQDPGITFNTQGAILTNTPTDYIAPPQPATAPLTTDAGGTQPGQEWW